MDIIVTYCERWDTPLRTSKHHYIERLALDGHRILYVEVPANPVSVILKFYEFASQSLPRLMSGLELVAENIWVMTGFVPLPYHPALWGIFDRLRVNEINQHFLLPRLRAAQARLGFQAPILLSYYPFSFPILHELKPARTIFHIVDEWQGMAGIPSSMAKLTKGMLNSADVTIVTSARLFERYRHSAKRIELLRHGANIALFGAVAEGKVNPDSKMLTLPGRKIGYYGALHKLDIRLIFDVAEARPDWSFIFVGPISGGQGIIRQGALPPNVYLVGEMPHASLPKFLASLDAAWMPFLVNELTQSMSPIKIFEVLSAGLPLVISNLEECRAIAGKNALFAITSDEHLDQLECAVMLRGPKDTQQRVNAMKGCDWEFRYQNFLQLLMG